MIHAYDKVYLNKAQAVLGRMLDFSVHDLHYEISHFFNLFIASGLAKDFGQGDFILLAGKSGVELAYEVLQSTTNVIITRCEPKYPVDRSQEYWTGWALAYYQWETAQPFEEIVRYIPINDIQHLYSPFHEMDIRQFVHKMNQLYHSARPQTNLKLLRQQADLSQRELSLLSGVPLRTIQQYEQRQKSINKAQAAYLIMLAQTLCCRVENLIEYVE